MEFVNRRVTITNYISHSINPNIRVCHNGAWVQNSVTGAYFGDPISNVATPGLKHPYHPYKDVSSLSYHDLIIIYKTLLEFQKFIRYLCYECKADPENYLNDYMDMADDYLIYEGNTLYPFTYYLITQNVDTDTGQVRPLRYYPMKTTTPFLDTMMGKYGGLNTVLWCGQTPNPNDDKAGKFMGNYLKQKGKLGKIINAIYEYRMASIDRMASACDLATAELTKVEGEVYQAAQKFMNTNFSCDKVIVSNPGSSAVNISQITFPVILTQDIKDLGIFFVPAEMWKCGKKYKAGDIFMFNGGVYTVQGDYSGWYCAKTNKIYFDVCNVDGDGFPTELIKNGDDYTNCKATVTNTAAAVTMQARWDSQLCSLRAYRKGATNWYDTEGEYKAGVKFHEEQTDETGSTKYESYILSIQQSSPEVGHDVITYTYIIDQLNTNPYPQTGVKYKDEYHRYKVGASSFYYDFTQNSYVEYQSYNLGNYANTYGSNGGVFPNGDPTRFDYFQLSKKEYYEGLVFEPVKTVNININRQINRAFENHMALGEIRTFYQVVNYRNGGYFKIKDLTQTNNKTDITYR
jgi:hypothetical protein